MSEVGNTGQESILLPPKLKSVIELGKDVI
jgi:hypothetical protein